MIREKARQNQLTQAVATPDHEIKSSKLAARRQKGRLFPCSCGEGDDAEVADEDDAALRTFEAEVKAGNLARAERADGGNNRIIIAEMRDCEHGSDVASRQSLSAAQIRITASSQTQQPSSVLKMALRHYET